MHENCRRVRLCGYSYVVTGLLVVVQRICLVHRFKLLDWTGHWTGLHGSQKDRFFYFPRYVCFLVETTTKKFIFGRGLNARYFCNCVEYAGADKAIKWKQAQI